MKRAESALLRECIESIIVEDYGGFDVGGGGDAIYGPYGANFASPEQLHKIFIKPFADVFDVATGKTKEIVTRALTVARVAFESAMTSIVPALKSDYDKIFAREKSNLDKIRTDYGAAYQATWDAFNNKDLLIAAFMFSPAKFLTVKLAQQAPEVASTVLSVLTGGRFDNVLSKIVPKSSATKSKSSGVGGGGGGGASPDSFFSGGGDAAGGAFYESRSRLTEKKDDDKKKEKDNKLVDLLSDKRVQEMIASDPKSRELSSASREVIEEALIETLKRAKQISNVKTIEDVKRVMGSKMPKLDELIKLPSEQRAPVEQQLLKAVKSSMKEVFAQALEFQMKHATDLGVPREHPYVRAHLNVASKIRAL